MMYVVEMRMRVLDRFVRMDVGVRLITAPIETVRMLMMNIVGMRVLMLCRQMRVLVTVVLREMEPDAKAHEKSCNEQRDGHRSPQACGEQRADKGGE